MGIPVVVYNPLGWERSGEVTAHVQGVEGGRERVGRADRRGEDATTRRAFADVKLHVLHVPALGYKVVWLGGKGAASSRESDAVARRTPATRSRWRTQALRVAVDKQTGCITSLFDKKIEFRDAGSGRVRQPAAVLQGHAEGLRRVEHRSRARWMLRRTTIEHADSVELVKTAEPAIRVTRHWQNSKFVQTISLSAEGDDGRRRQRHRLARSAHSAEGGIPAGGNRAVCDLRDSLRHDRPADHAQQLVGEGAVRSAGACAGPTSATASTG